MSERAIEITLREEIRALRRDLDKEMRNRNRRVHFKAIAIGPDDSPYILSVDGAGALVAERPSTGTGSVVIANL
jgi:hypothetical protein